MTYMEGKIQYRIIWKSIENNCESKDMICEGGYNYVRPSPPQMFTIRLFIFPFHDDGKGRYFAG